MNIYFELILNVLSITIPYRILAYYPFWEHLRFKKKWVIYIIIITEIIFIGIFFLCAKFNIPLRPIEFIFSAICFVIYNICINIKIYKILFFYSFIFEYIMILRGLSLFLTKSFFSDNTITYFSWQTNLIHLGLFLAVLPFVLLLFRKTAKCIFESDNYSIWKIIWLLPSLTIIVTIIFTNTYNYNVQFLLVRICLLICTFVVYYLLLASLNILKEKTIMEEWAKHAEAINDFQKSQYNLLKKYIEETRIARHDLRQHLNLIQSYLDNGDNEALKNYLAEYKKSLPSNTDKTYCKNYTINVVISYYAQQAELSNIEFFSNVDISENISISDPDICVILGNLMENAIEACKRQKSEKKFIRICGKIIGENALSLTIDNSCDNHPIFQGDNFISSKRDTIGIGHLSIKNIAEKYNGVANFKYENGIFFASVLLNP